MRTGSPVDNAIARGLDPTAAHLINAALSQPGGPLAKSAGSKAIPKHPDRSTCQEWRDLRRELNQVARSACGAAELGVRLRTCLGRQPGLLCALLGGSMKPPSGGGGELRELLPLPTPPLKAITATELTAWFKDGQPISREARTYAAQCWLALTVDALKRHVGEWIDLRGALGVRYRCSA